MAYQSLKEELRRKALLLGKTNSRFDELWAHFYAARKAKYGDRGEDYVLWRTDKAIFYNWWGHDENLELEDVYPDHGDPTEAARKAEIEIEAEKHRAAAKAKKERETKEKEGRKVKAEDTTIYKQPGMEDTKGLSESTYSGLAKRGSRGESSSSRGGSTSTRGGSNREAPTGGESTRGGSTRAGSNREESTRGGRGREGPRGEGAGNPQNTGHSDALNPGRSFNPDLGFDEEQTPYYCVWIENQMNCENLFLGDKHLVEDEMGMRFFHWNVAVEAPRPAYRMVVWPEQSKAEPVRWPETRVKEMLENGYRLLAGWAASLESSGKVYNLSNFYKLEFKENENVVGWTGNCRYLVLPPIPPPEEEKTKVLPSTPREGMLRSAPVWSAALAARQEKIVDCQRRIDKQKEIVDTLSYFRIPVTADKMEELQAELACLSQGKDWPPPKDSSAEQEQD